MATSDMGSAGLLWIGEKFYKTPAEFDAEAMQLGVSRRIHAIPRQFKVGETWILLAHPKAIKQTCADCIGAGLIANGDTSVCATCDGKGEMFQAAIFKVWKPSRIEKILPESKRDSAEVAELEKRGITAVFVPDDDPDHQGTVYDKDDSDDDASV